MKHWGLQYQKRLEDFCGAFACTRCELSGAEDDVRRIEQQLTAARNKACEIQARNGANCRAVKSLMGMGPWGLSRIEGESGPELSIREFLNELDKPGLAAAALKSNDGGC